jgi:hypothetical protein
MAELDFNIDCQQVGAVLADSFIKQLQRYKPSDRIAVLRAMRDRIADENAEFKKVLENG